MNLRARVRAVFIRTRSAASSVQFRPDETRAKVAAASRSADSAGWSPEGSLRRFVPQWFPVPRHIYDSARAQAGAGSEARRKVCKQRSLQEKQRATEGAASVSSCTGYAVCMCPKAELLEMTFRWSLEDARNKAAVFGRSTSPLPGIFVTHDSIHQPRQFHAEIRILSPKASSVAKRSSGLVTIPQFLTCRRRMAHRGWWSHAQYQFCLMLLRLKAFRPFRPC